MIDINKCPICSANYFRHTGTMSTLVGYISFVDADGKRHDHDDNCLSRKYICKNHHQITISKRRNCWCGWQGKSSCFCHEGHKVNEWPMLEKELLKNE